MLNRNYRMLSALSDRLNLGTRSFALVANVNSGIETLRDGMRRRTQRIGSIPGITHAITHAFFGTRPCSPAVAVVVAVPQAGWRAWGVRLAAPPAWAVRDGRLGKPASWFGVAAG
jgi:hypothetical protein